MDEHWKDFMVAVAVLSGCNTITGVIAEAARDAGK